MAEKVYTRGEVVNIFGTVFGSGIALASWLALTVGLVLSKSVKILFWGVGKQIDFPNYNHIRSQRSQLKKRFAKPTQFFVPEQEAPVFTPQNFNDYLSVIQTSTEYAQKAYENSMLPVEEILKIDEQAHHMCTATIYFIKNQPKSQLRNQRLAAVQAQFELVSLYQKYHSTGNEKYLFKAQSSQATTIVKPVRAPFQEPSFEIDL